MTYEKQKNNFKSIIDEGNMSSFQIVIVALCFILNMNDGIDVLIVSFSSVEIIKEWGLSKADMGYVFSIGLVGMALGCFLIAPIGDKVGRRKIFIISLIMISSGMLLVSFCTSYTQLLAFRLLTGLGIGGILPTMASTASEFSNNKFRDFNVGLVQAGWPVGAIFTGFFCAYAIPEFGWRFAFLIAGCISTFMLVIVLVFMRDSFGFLLRIQPKNAIQKINKLLVELKQDMIQFLPEKPIENNNETYKLLFTNEFKDSTIKLWTAVFFGFLTLYTLMSWVPNIAKEAGLPFEMATYVGVSLNIGAAIGTISVGIFASKFGLKRTVFCYMLLAFFVMLVYGNITLTNTLIFIVILSIGLFVQGGFNGLYPILSRVYPTEIRSTGVGYAVGIGRVGAILGPTLFGLLSDNGLSTTLLFSLFSLPLLITGICVKKLNAQNLS